MKISKSLLGLAALLSVSAAGATATFSYPTGWVETLDNYPSDADVLNFANGRTDSRAANVYATGNSIAGNTDYRFTRQTYDIDRTASWSYFGQASVNCWQTIVPWDVLKNRFAVSIPFAAWATKPRATGVSAAQYATALLTNGHLVYIVQPALRQNNAWWDPSAPIVMPQSVMGVQSAAQRYNQGAGLVPTVVRSYLDTTTTMPALARQITVYSQEGHAYTFMRGGLGTASPYNTFDSANGVNGQTSGSALFGNFFVNSGGRYIPKISQGLRDQAGNPIDGTTMVSYAWSNSLPPSRSYGTGGVTWDPQGSLSAAYSFVSLNGSQLGSVGNFWRSGSKVISSANGLYGDNRAPFKATFNHKALPLEFFVDDPVQVQQGHRFGAYVYHRDWDSNYRVNYWSWATEIPYNAHLFEREGYYRVVTIPVMTFANGSRPPGTDTQFSFDRNSRSYADWAQARVQEILVAGCFEWAQVSYQLVPVDTRDAIFLNYPAQSSTTIKVYKDNFARRLRHQVDPNAYYQDSEYNVHLDKKWESLLNKGILKLVVKRSFLPAANGTPTLIETQEFRFPDRTPLPNGAKVIPDPQDASRIIAKIPLRLLFAASPCRADKLPDAQSQPDMSTWANIWGYRQDPKQ